MRKSKQIAKFIESSLKQKKNYSGPNMFKQPQTNAITKWDFVNRVQNVVNATVRDFPKTDDKNADMFFSGFLNYQHTEIQRLVDKGKFHAATKACEAVLDPYNKGEMNESNQELYRLYELYVDLLDKGGSFSDHHKAIKVLERALELFPDNLEFKERKQYIEESFEVQRLINEGKIKTI